MPTYAEWQAKINATARVYYPVPPLTRMVPFYEGSAPGRLISLFINLEVAEDIGLFTQKPIEIVFKIGSIITGTMPLSKWLALPPVPTPEEIPE